MGALDTVIHFHRQTCNDPECYADAEALSELAELRTRVAKLERERDAARTGHDYAVAEQAKSTAYITELLARNVELEAQAATVRPHQCDACRRGFERAREAAAKFLDGKIMTDEESEEFVWSQDFPQMMAEKIRAMQFTPCGDSCVGCQAVKPQTSVCPDCGCEHGKHAACCNLK